MTADEVLKEIEECVHLEQALDNRRILIFSLLSLRGFSAKRISEEMGHGNSGNVVFRAQQDEDFKKRAWKGIVNEATVFTQHELEQLKIYKDNVNSIKAEIEARIQEAYDLGASREEIAKVSGKGRGTKGLRGIIKPSPRFLGKKDRTPGRKKNPNYEEEKARLEARDGLVCQLCKNDASSLNFFHIDHIEPVSKGGSEDLSNKRLLCPSCNSTKNNKLSDEQVIDRVAKRHEMSGRDIFSEVENIVLACPAGKHQASWLISQLDGLVKTEKCHSSSREFQIMEELLVEHGWVRTYEWVKKRGSKYVYWTSPDGWEPSSCAF